MTHSVDARPRPCGRHRRSGWVIAAALGLCTPALNAQPVSKVIVAQAELKPLPATIRLVGTVRPNRASRIASEVAGLVAELPVREGDLLRQGDLICRLKTETLTLELQAAEARLASLVAAVDIAKADLQRWTLEKQRVTRLNEQDRANAKELYDTQADFLMALNRVQEAERQVSEQQALVELRRVDLDKTTIQAPFDGYVVVLRSEAGEWLTLGGAVVDMIDIGQVRVRVDVPEAALQYVEVGQSVRVAFGALSETFTGTIGHIIPQAHEMARTFPVDIEIPNPEHRLTSGLFAWATVRSGPADDVVSVPKDAVVHKDGFDRVWMVQDAGPQGTMAIPLSVSLGAEVGDWVAVTSGNVAAGMILVVRGNERLMPFPSKVVVVDDQALFTDAAGPPPTHGTE